MVAVTHTNNSSHLETSPLRNLTSPLRTSQLATRELKIGVVGYGYWGPKLARNLHDTPGASLHMVADLREERLAELHGLYPDVETTRSYQELLNSDVDGIVIATPVRTHYPLAKAALFAGKHVLIEKPITSKAEHAEELIQLAAERNLTLMVGHTFVYNPAVDAVRDLVQGGELGEVYYMNSVRANLGLLQPDINVMWDLGPHDISMIQYILGEEAVRVSARGAVYVNKRTSLHEVVHVHLTFESGITAQLRLSWLDPIKQRALTVIGSSKMLVYNDIKDDKVWLYDKGVEIPPYAVTEEEFKASYRHGEEKSYPVQWKEPLQAEVNQFLRSIRTGEPSKSTGEDGLKVVKVLETAQRSLKNHGAELYIEY